MTDFASHGPIVKFFLGKFNSNFDKTLEEDYARSKPKVGKSV